MSKSTLKPGDAVRWETSQGKTEGHVKRKLTRPMQIKGHHVAASKDHPQLLVESDASGGIAAHKPGSVTKRKRPTRAK